MTDKEIRKELLDIAVDMCSYEFHELEDYDRKFIETAPIQRVFWFTQGAVNSDDSGFYQEKYGERIAKIEKALKDMWLLA